MRVCVVGAGTSGLEAARAASKYSDVTVIEALPSIPVPKYLWPHTLCSEIEKRKKDSGFEIILGSKVVSVEGGCRVRTQDSLMRFDSVILCTGSELRCRRFRERKEGLIYLERFDSFQKFAEYSKENEAVSVIGSGIMALETINALLERGKKVTLFKGGSVSSGLLPQALDNHLSSLMASFGVEVVNSFPSRVVGDAVVAGGRIYPCRVAGVIPEIIPSINPLTGRREYIRVDSFMHYSERILAAGSCAYIRIGNTYLNFSFENTSKTMGMLAGLNSSGYRFKFNSSASYISSIGRFKISASGMRKEKATAAGYSANEFIHRCEDNMLEIVYDKSMRLVGFFFAGKDADEKAILFLSNSVGDPLARVLGSDISQYMLCREFTVSDVIREILAVRDK